MMRFLFAKTDCILCGDACGSSNAFFSLEISSANAESVILGVSSVVGEVLTAFRSILEGSSVLNVTSDLASASTSGDVEICD